MSIGRAGKMGEAVFSANPNACSQIGNHAHKPPIAVILGRPVFPAIGLVNLVGIHGFDTFVHCIGASQEWRSRCPEPDSVTPCIKLIVT